MYSTNKDCSTFTKKVKVHTTQIEQNKRIKSTFNAQDYCLHRSLNTLISILTQQQLFVISDEILTR